MSIFTDPLIGSEMTLGEMSHKQALQDPGATVRVCLDKKISYGELEESSSRLAGWLLERPKQFHSSSQTLEFVPQGVATASVSGRTNVSRPYGLPWCHWVVTALAWFGIFAVLFLGLIFCSAAAVGLVVSHLPQ